jgi:hypothetical protein
MKEGRWLCVKLLSSLTPIILDPFSLQEVVNLIGNLRIVFALNEDMLVRKGQVQMLDLLGIRVEEVH